MAPTEYNGPIQGAPTPQPRGRSGFLEYEEEPCPKCKKPLLGRFNEKVTLGGNVITQHMPGRECRNGCEEGRRVGLGG